MALTLLFHEFKENFKIHNVIINHQRKENEHLIDIYCLEKDNLKKEKNHLVNLYYEDGLSYDLAYGQPNWELPKETKLVFSFKKKNILFFFLIALLISSRK